MLPNSSEIVSLPAACLPRPTPKLSMSLTTLCLSCLQPRLQLALTYYSGPWAESETTFSSVTSPCATATPFIPCT